MAWQILPGYRHYKRCNVSDHKTYVVVGSSAAGVGALLKLRQLDPVARIICISAESYFPYNKCFLADYASGLLLQDQLFLMTPERINELRIDLVLNTRVTNINSHKKIVITNDNQEFSYDQLLLALGSSPYIPPIDGSYGNGVFTFHTLADVENIFKFCDERKVEHVAVIGAGVTGVECADALYNKGKKVSIIERGMRLLPYLMPEHQSEQVAQAMRNRGVNLFLNAQVSTIEHTHGVVSFVQINIDVSIPTHLVVIATGVKGNTELAQRAGLQVGSHGVMVDEFFKTSNPHIFAAGDIIETKDTLSGHTIATRLWPDAMNQGMRAAMSMAGTGKKYDGVIPLVKSHFFGMDYLSLGWNSKHVDKTIIFEKKTFTVGVQVSNDKIRGISVLGKDFDISLCRQAVLTKMSADEFQSSLL